MDEMTENAVTAIVPSVNRHDPTLIARVGELLEDGRTHAEIAQAVGCSERTIDTVVSENESLAPSRARACERLAARLIDEGTTIIDAPIPAENASAEVQRARNRADWRWRRAGAEHPAKYREQAAGVTVNVATKIDLGAILPARPTQPDREVT